MHTPPPSLGSDKFRGAGWRTLALIAAGALLLLSAAGETDNDGAIAVYGSVSPLYHRTPLAGGSFKPETYAFGEGGLEEGTQNDFTIDKLRFLDIARLIAPALAAKNYLPCKPADANQADLLIMVYWGTTIGTDDTASSAQYQIAQALVPPPMPPPPAPPNGQGGTAMVSDPSASGRAGAAETAAAIQSANDSALQQSLTLMAMANHRRDRQNFENARILGYLPELERVNQMSILGQRHSDVVAEIEESRYFVILLAYDFQTLRRHQQRKLLWETRFSIPQRRSDFSKELAAMAQSASRYFGQDSHGLTRKSMRTEHITLGEMEVIQVEPDKK